MQTVLFLLMHHIEFIHREHFEFRYSRTWATQDLSPYIDFCWETNFEGLSDIYPNGFSDVLFPNIGYSYLINLGTPFKVHLENKVFEIKMDGFLPRHDRITAQHYGGNKIFGIKFKICPIIFEKDVDFSEYKKHIYPLTYLIDRKVVEHLRNASSFRHRSDIVLEHYKTLIDKHAGSLKYVTTVTDILKGCVATNRYDSIKTVADNYRINKRTLQRYFEASTSFSTKQALQNIRIRKAITQLLNAPSYFNYKDFGYYDYSHFCKHLKQFLSPAHFKTFHDRYGKNIPVKK